MDYRLIIRPLIGAVIGYVTNWIAVKMMFRPLKPIKIGEFTFPFTPGIIPKNKERIAESIGNAINENLLTTDTLQATLLSDNIKMEFRNSLNSYITSLSNDSRTIKDSFLLYLNEDKYNENLNSIKTHLTNSIYNTVLDANLGEIVSNQIEIAAKERFKGSILGALGGNAIVSSISETAKLKVNDYMENNGKELIGDMVYTELNKYTSYKISMFSNIISNSNIDIVSILMNIYEKFITNNLSNMLETINISKIVKDKISSMDTLELEKIILSIMKKELNALVNLGALIGFILGLLNLLF